MIFHFKVCEDLISGRPSAVADHPPAVSLTVLLCLTLIARVYVYSRTTSVKIDAVVVKSLDIYHRIFSCNMYSVVRRRVTLELL